MNGAILGYLHDDPQHPEPLPELQSDIGLNQRQLAGTDTLSEAYRPGAGLRVLLAVSLRVP